MFFTYSGLNTRWTWSTRSRAAADRARSSSPLSILAKFGACWAAARLSGEDNRTALGIGALMNSRGLMELIIINIGLQTGHHRPGAVLDAGADGDRHHADGRRVRAVYGKQARDSGELGEVPQNA